MSKWLNVVVVVVGIITVCLALFPHKSRALFSISEESVFQNALVSERQRIQNRLALIEELLRARDVSRLSVKLRKQRLKNLDILHAYWKRGVFPRNTNKEGQRIPFFIDEYGTPCAVGHLIIESGKRQLAELIAHTDNNIFADKISNQEFNSWAANSGLFPEELFLIQPTYDFIRPNPIKSPPPAKPGTRVIRVGDNMLCYNTANTFMMRDTSSSCGASMAFCTTPLKCFSSVTGQNLGGGVATCRANSGSGASVGSAKALGITPPSGASCPDLQTCADDERQEFIAEEDSWKWRELGDDDILYRTHSLRTVATGSHR